MTIKTKKHALFTIQDCIEKARNLIANYESILEVGKRRAVEDLRREYDTQNIRHRSSKNKIIKKIPQKEYRDVIHDTEVIIEGEYIDKVEAWVKSTYGTLLTIQGFKKSDFDTTLDNLDAYLDALHIYEEKINSGPDILTETRVSNADQDISKSKKTKTKNNFRTKSGIKFNKTGQVYLDNRLLGELKPGTNQYALFRILFEYFPDTVSYKNLARSILKKCNKTTQSKSTENFCQTIKSKIKEIHPGIAKLIKCFKNKKGRNGYKLAIK